MSNASRLTMLLWIELAMSTAYETLGWRSMAGLWEFRTSFLSFDMRHAPRQRFARLWRVRLLTADVCTSGQILHNRANVIILRF